MNSKRPTGFPASRMRLGYPAASLDVNVEMLYDMNAALHGYSYFGHRHKQFVQTV